MIKTVAVLLVAVAFAVAYDNGVAHTPPMGWVRNDYAKLTFAEFLESIRVCTTFAPPVNILVAILMKT
jgi:hypothetical protein